MPRNTVLLISFIATAAVWMTAQVDPEQIRERNAAIQAFRDSPSVTAFTDSAGWVASNPVYATYFRQDLLSVVPISPGR